MQHKLPREPSLCQKLKMWEGESRHRGVFNGKSCGQLQSPKGRSQCLVTEVPEAPLVSGSYGVSLS